MSTEEAAPASATAPEASPAPAPATTTTTEEPSKPASAAKPKSASSDPKKKVARASTGGSNKKTSFGGSGGKKAPSAHADKTYNHGELVLARLKGYPAWPARIADPATVSAEVKKAKPPRSTNVYAVEFFPAGDYAWLPNRELQPLTSKMITDFLSEGHRKASGSMREGYEIAQDPKKWDSEQADLRQAREAAEVEEDELEDEDEQVEASGGKRKKPTKEKSKAKKPKTAKKNGLSAADVKDEEDEQPKSKATKGKADKSKAKPTSSKPENQAPVDDDPLAQNPECVKVKDWRHKLQRAFLGKAMPSADEMPTYDSLFKTIEEYKDITIDALTYSKIGKVMKKLATTTNIPRNDEFKITDRASKLMQDWQNIIAANGTEGANGDAAVKEPESKADAGAGATEGAEPKQSNDDPAVNGTGEGEASAEKTEADTKMDVESTPA